MRERVERRAALVRERIMADTAAQERKAPTIGDRSYEIDLWSDAARLPPLRRTLEQLGFSPFRAFGQRDHRFFIEHLPGGWGKVDVKLSDEQERRRLSDLAWLLRRKRGLVVAVLGADGSGKTTAIEAVVRRLPMATRSAYLGRGRPARRSAEGTVQRPSFLRQLAGLVRWTATSFVRVGRVEYWAWRGNVVLCDRHPIEAGSVVSAEPEPVRAAKRFVARRLLPRPGLVVFLDAPGDVLYRRKGEHSPQALDAMGAALREIAASASGSIIRADRDSAAVGEALQSAIWDALRARRAE